MGSRGGATGDLIFEKIPTVYRPTDDQRASARLIVCANSSGSIEAKELLEMLGLLDD